MYCLTAATVEMTNVNSINKPIVEAASCLVNFLI